MRHGSRFAARARGHRRRGGFSLLEVLIASSVLVVAVSTAFMSQVSSLNLISTTRENNTAISDLQMAMEELLVLPLDQVPVAGSRYEDGTAIASYAGLHLRNEQITCSYPGYVAGAPVPDPLEIRLTLAWTDWAGRARIETLSTLKTR